MTKTAAEAPTRKVGTVEMVSVEWLLQNLTYAADLGPIEDDSDFRALISMKCDYSLAEVLPAVIEDGFMVPIVISVRNGGVLLGNGHHRFVAALLTCAPEIMVYWSDSYNGCDGDDFEHSTGEGGKYMRSTHYGDDYDDWRVLVDEVAMNL